MTAREKRIRTDAKILRQFVKIYCKKHHQGQDVEGYCADCGKILEYALKRDQTCRLEPKPKCKDCKIHCYKPEMRQKIKEIMKFSGIFCIKRGRIDWLLHYFF